MLEGSIQTAVDNGRYLLRFNGDVRLTLCAALDEFIETMFSDPEFVCVSIDLTKAKCLDSTSLGLLAKLALRAEKDFEMQPLLFSTNDDVSSVLDNMGLDELFSVQQCVPDLAACDALLESLKEEGFDENSIKKRIIEAHKVLMSLSEENRLAFQDLMKSLH